MKHTIVLIAVVMSAILIGEKMDNDRNIKLKQLEIEKSKIRLDSIKAVRNES